MNKRPEHETVHERMASDEFQEKLLRDTQLTERVQAGFTPAEPSEQNPRPLVTDGVLNSDASEALGELFESYQPLINGIANKIFNQLNRPPALNKDDLVQEGFYALFRCALNWSSENARGGFLSYARIGLVHSIKRKANVDSSCIRLPHSKRDMVNRYRNIFWLDYNESEHLPRRQRIARILGVSIEEINDTATLEAMTNQMGSIDGGYFDDDRDQHSTYSRGDGRWKPIDPSASEMREVEEDILISDIQRLVRTAIDPSCNDVLDERSAKVLRLRFFGIERDSGPLTLEEVGLELGITRERVRQIEASALAILRHPSVSEKLRGLLSTNSH